MNDYFRNAAKGIRLDHQLVEDGLLREAQLGACSAIVAHASSSEDPAQIVLPTGVGKSLVLITAPFLLGAKRVLVVAPARLVRDQLANGFKTLDQLRVAGIVPDSLKPPVVKLARNRAGEEDWERWHEANVVVGTVNVLSDGYPEVTRVPRDMFDLILFDEAHHLPASTWTKLLDAVDSRAVLLTATPFRSDRKRLPGQISYTYPLARAIERGVYAPVSFVPVEPKAGQDKDGLIAATAKERLESVQHVEAKSKLLVRAERVEEAKRLVGLYQGIGVPLGLVEATTSARTVTRTLKRVSEGELMGFACVGALIEGFDFPTLKIAAYHAPHRSLQPTLQFIGRLSRVTTVDGELIADPRDLSKDTEELYRGSEEWKVLLPAIVDSAVDEEKATRAFMEHGRTGEAGEELVPWLAITPPRSVQVYELGERPNLDLNLGKLARVPVAQSLYQPEADLFAAITEERMRPRFLRTPHLDGTLHRLHLATWVEEHGLLFISSDRPGSLKQLRELLGADQVPLIGSQALRRLLKAAEKTRFFSVGLRESRPRQASLASYETKAGRSADSTIAETDTETKTLGHAMGRNADGSFGVSTGKGKYWEPKAAANLFEFRNWCLDCARVIREEVPVGGGKQSAMARLRIPDHLSEFPQNPLAAVFSEMLLVSDRVFVFGPGTQEVHPLELELDVERVDDRTLRFALCQGEDELATVTQDVTGSTGTDDIANWVDRSTGEAEPLAAVLESSPPLVFFGDGSFTEGGKGAELAPQLKGPVPAFVEGLDWTGVDTTAEAKTPQTGMDNIQMGTQNRLLEDGAWLITDHGTGELADFIKINKGANGEVVASLVHCKGSKKAPGGRVDDLYEVLGQAIRSVRWCRPGPSFWAELQGRLQERNQTKLLAGDPEGLTQELARWAGNDAPIAAFKVLVVQPAVKLAETGSSANIHTLLHATHDYFHNQDAELVVWCNTA